MPGQRKTISPFVQLEKGVATKKNDMTRKSPAAQWLGLSAFTAWSLGSVPGRGTKIPQAAQRGKNKINKIKSFEKQKRKKNDMIDGLSFRTSISERAEWTPGAGAGVLAGEQQPIHRQA